MIGDPWIALDGDGIPLIASDCLTFSVFRYRPDLSGPDRYEFMPHVQFLGDAVQEGTDPGMASFRYIFGMGIGPQSFTQALDISYTGPGILDPGDRIIVRTDRPDGVTGEIVWDGFVTAFDFEIGEDSEYVPFTSVGVARALWDTPISGRMQRNADDPATGDDVDVDLPAVFNPDGMPNCTPEDHDHDAIGFGVLSKHPVFLDETILTPGYGSRTWDLSGAARYLIFHHNPDEEYVTNPASPDVDSLLSVKVPLAGVPFDPGDDSTYEARPIPVASTPIDGRDWPNVLYDMVRDEGFGVVFRLGTQPDGQPGTTLDLFEQQAGPLKDVWMQAEGSNLDPGFTNMVRAAIGRDVTDVVDRWEVRGAVERYEADFILECGYPAVPIPSGIADLEVYTRSHPSFTTIPGRNDAYRLYVLDECGEGHYEPGTSVKLRDAADLTAMLDPDDLGDVVIRRRPPIGKLLTLDANDKPCRASLMVSLDYDGSTTLWDGTGTWQEVQGGWSLLRDRVGIRVTSENPNKWDIGDSADATMPYPAGIVRGVEDMATAGAKNFVLKLTCVIEGDRHVVGVADPTPRSASKRPVTRVIDARDLFRKDTITRYSRYSESSSEDHLLRDDTGKAEHQAMAARTSTECGVIEGTVVIPYFTNYYRIGDRIRSVAGRGLSFRTDKGGDEAPAYPVVVGVAHDCVEDQTTTLQISDAGTARKNYERRTRRRNDGRL